ncbi:hypothetical protein AVEN_29850-1 [Araneus ventricosus]|uniref:Uncharacterized protein n=1 Tax=Araneus ventricosus TaxID=182803 RepID=A0A4Y2K461_ARAVE|nr:hypothetical protein AVEN_29850-1 [Araneus ventricosus]
MVVWRFSIRCLLMLQEQYPLSAIQFRVQLIPNCDEQFKLEAEFSRVIFPEKSSVKSYRTRRDRRASRNLTKNRLVVKLNSEDCVLKLPPPIAMKPRHPLSKLLYIRVKDER